MRALRNYAPWKLTRSMIRGALECPEFMMVTTDFLSHHNCKRFPVKKGCHIAHATTIGKRSCHWILIPRSLPKRMWGVQRCWNHFPGKKTPESNVLAASVNSSKSGAGVVEDSRKKERPFHFEIKTLHMARSLKNSLLSLTW